MAAGRELIMIKVMKVVDSWDEYKNCTWGGGLETLNEIEAQCREEEAAEIIEAYFSEDVLGYIPSAVELNDFIWFSLPDIMHLYDEEDDENDNDDEEDEEYDEDEE
jgi:hypothetical protein